MNKARIFSGKQKFGSFHIFVFPITSSDLKNLQTRILINVIFRWNQNKNKNKVRKKKQLKNDKFFFFFWLSIRTNVFECFWFPSMMDSNNQTKPNTHILLHMLKMLLLLLIKMKNLSGLLFNSGVFVCLLWMDYSFTFRW